MKTKKIIGSMAIILFQACFVSGQFTRLNQDSIRKITLEDHQRMMKILGIDSLRPAPSGTPGRPNSANTDESKAGPFSPIPDPLIMNNGSKVSNEKQWWTRRRLEIQELFDREVYGRVPTGVPPVRWEVTGVLNDTIGKYPVITKKLVGHVDNSGFPEISVNIDLTLTVPSDADKPVPVIMEFGFAFPVGTRTNSGVVSNTVKAPVRAVPSWQEQVIAEGWGFAILVPASIQADWGAGLRSGIIGLTNKGEPRKPDDWGSLRAWAWGASRSLDYFETDKMVDASKVEIEGLSRYGKAAAVAMAYDQRFAIGFIGSSGAGGLKLYRRIYGEQVENLAASGEYHWFAGNFIKYASTLTQDDLPVDAHELLALCAPRPVFISAGAPGIEGGWVDAKGMFLAGVYAGSVYELLGRKGLGISDFPEVGVALTGGDIAFRMHEAGHTTGPNWPYFIGFARRYLNK
ncbi:MAG: glucuronyl esterase domain-containing protein [Bacteroidales bacterium]